MLSNLLLVLAVGDPAFADPASLRPIAEHVAAMSAHYAAVLDELAAADTARLSDVQRVARGRSIEVLRAYRERADFGRGVDPRARVPFFVDAEGRRCAVAELLHASGEVDLVERVRATNNQAWILELAGDVAFERWLVAHGLTFNEAARIQSPVPADPAPGGDPAPAGGSYTGPGDTAGGGAPASPPPSGGGGSTPAPSGNPGGVVGGGSAPTSGRAPVGSPAPSPASMTTTSDDGWWLWWEYAKLEFLVPNRLTLANAPMTGDDAVGALRDAIERARRAGVARFADATRAPEAAIRAAGAVALGQCAGKDAVAPLVALLDDPSQEVRHRAILALGATGSPAAAVVLLAIARTGSHVEGSRADLSPYARSMAIVALGLARAAGADDALASAVANVAHERNKDEREGIALATMFHHVLAPSPLLEAVALELAQDETQSPSVRCRAVEALGSTRDPKTLAKLQTWLAGPRMDVRRSSAIALGIARDASVLPALQTAHELEAEGLTRGFVLIAIGRIGGAQAHSYLSKVLAKGEAGQRRWAALALGVLARGTNDPETSKLLRDAWADEKNAEARGAYWLACGLVRDELAIPGLEKELATAADPRQRMYAATALSLVGGPRCAAILRQRLPKETNPMARVGIAQALGILGENQDVPGMRAGLDLLSEPGLQGLAATALAFHGTPEALAQLVELSAAEGSRVRRAASLEGLGLMLARGKPFELGRLSRRLNYTVIPDWAQGMFLTML